ncbi:deoxynucleoside triphosphate triphosphohydrolase SAMHD1 homolog [Anopheles marshallii]|uniref:deoxynucleoside triphosphate triphosphohydrolase SAMHD1 homolog n=1 Tax=Anopheles marshallii TaxID=1521116 RepID=UPI00237C4ED2|nr:deoxynucleoside triphosphate triphosphohydrolase SAMHD1 homolog [Anopheles marshallii]
MERSSIRSGGIGVAISKTEMEPSDLTVQDAVYGTFHLPSYVRAVVASEEFTRLKHLKQLGVSNVVFETALHTRYDHSLGACYLAGSLLKEVNKTLDKPITEDERKCVMLAAVLHDLGHGPFSHLWEKFVEAYGAHWRHERSSVELARNLLDRMEVVSEKQINLICALIRGDASELLDADRQFMTQIVSSDVDVDRCDYLQRDAHSVPGIIKPSRPFRRMFDRVRVVTVQGKGQLAYHWEDYPLVYEMACARQMFHCRCYQDPKVLGAELMMLDVMHEAEQAGFRFLRNGHSEQLSKIHGKPDLFKYLDDNIIGELASSNLPQLQRARGIINRLQNKDLYEEIVRFSIDMTKEIKEYNCQQREPIVVQAVRYIKSAQQWFSSFNVTFYKPGTDGGIDIVSLEEARDLNQSVTCESVDEIEEYIMYCTSVDPEVQRRARHHFTHLLNGTTMGS